MRIEKPCKPRPRNCKWSHIVQVMTKNHSGRYLQNLRICFKKGNPVFKKGNPFPKGFKKGNPFPKGKSCFQEGKSCFQGKAHLETKPQDYRRPRSGQDWPGRNFPDLRFFSEVGREKSHSEASRRSGLGCAAGGLRGGRAADLPPGGFAEVGNASKADPGG